MAILFLTPRDAPTLAIIHAAAMGAAGGGQKGEQGDRIWSVNFLEQQLRRSCVIGLAGVEDGTMVSFLLAQWVAGTGGIGMGGNGMPIELIPAKGTAMECTPTERKSATKLITEKMVTQMATARSAEMGTVGTADILTLATLPNRQRRGWGRSLLLSLLVILPSPGDIFLEVAADNQPAIELYRRQGFVDVGRRTHYYGVGQDALLLHLCRP